MTKKHFNLLAAELKLSKPPPGQQDAIKAWENCVISVANVCRSFNARFDYDRFIMACGF